MSAWTTDQTPSKSKYMKPKTPRPSLTSSNDDKPLGRSCEDLDVRPETPNTSAEGKKRSNAKLTVDLVDGDLPEGPEPKRVKPLPRQENKAAVDAHKVLVRWLEDHHFKVHNNKLDNGRGTATTAR